MKGKKASKNAGASSKPAAAFELHITNRQPVLTLDPRWLENIARQTLAAEEVAAAEVSVAVVDNATIWTLNRQYLSHDYPTDVISFILEREPPLKPRPKPPRGRGASISGEIVLSAEMALTTAAEYDWPAEHEVALYLVHGLLHLCGYDDTTPSERKLMRSRENELLRPWGIVPPRRRRRATRSGDGGQGRHE